MTIIRWNPMNELMKVQREMDRIFSGFTKPRIDEEYESAVWTPMADITEDADKFTLTFDLPGIEKKDIKMNFTENTLKISGERKAVEETKDATCHRVERFYGKFYRAFTFPTLVDAEKINASYKDGVLTVVVPKAEETKPKQIEIK